LSTDHWDRSSENEIDKLANHVDRLTNGVCKSTNEVGLAEESAFQVLRAPCTHVPVAFSSRNQGISQLPVAFCIQAYLGVLRHSIKLDF
jgi:hypothetical protein